MNAVFLDYGNKYRHIKNENNKTRHLYGCRVIVAVSGPLKLTKKKWFLPKIVRPLLESEDITVVGQTQEIGNHKIIGVALAPPRKTWEQIHIFD